MKNYNNNNKTLSSHSSIPEFSVQASSSTPPLLQTLSSHSSTPEFNRTTTPPFGGSIVLQTRKKNILSKESKSLRKRHKSPKINGHILERKESWISLHIYGEPFERGFAHGSLLYKEIEKNQKRMIFTIQHIFETTIPNYMKMCKKKIFPVVKKKFPEFYEEIRGIVAGCKSRGLNISIYDIIAWNSTESLHSYYQKKTSRCSAFIATGNATEKGGIVMAHNTHCNFVCAQSFFIVLYITPSEGSPFIMQTAAGMISSTTDWFLCSTGIIGCETTISSVNFDPIFGSPYFCRIRKAMQYGKTLDDYVDIMLKNNAGDYASSWQFGDINTGEIMLLELGLKKHSMERTRDGVFYGMNSAMDFALRSEETTEKTHFDIKTSSGSRNARFNQLLNNTYYGKINTENAKKILSDHYDSFLHKEKMGSRNICKHTEMDPEKGMRGSYYPFGCTDGKVVDSDLAKNLFFYGRFGSSCGRVFNAKEHIRKHPEYDYMTGILEDFPKTDWTLLSPGSPRIK